MLTFRNNFLQFLALFEFYKQVSSLSLNDELFLVENSDFFPFMRAMAK
jgi:hypothetical protein